MCISVYILAIFRKKCVFEVLLAMQIYTYYMIYQYETMLAIIIVEYKT